MILVTGGSSQGKREFVRQYLGGQDTEPVVWTEGAEASWEEFMDGRFCRDFQLFVRRVMEGSAGPSCRERKGLSTDQILEQLLEELLAGPKNRVLVTDEIGCGIVWRVCCGAGMRIK